MERRAQPRVKPGDPLMVRMLLPGQLEQGEILDLNKIGVLVATEADLEAGTRVALQFEIPGDLQVNALQAVVARRVTLRSEGGQTPRIGLGLKFVADSQKDREAIHRVVTKILALDLLGTRPQKKPSLKPTDTVSFARPYYRPNRKPGS